ncbi:LysR family transcriptional regulator [Noviherbaspirillum saxi]|uniref:LysR family transcriptional regulator n=1 Tax=Noviherbaspirillum saxi TaxID=2320863 RepID=A0A3A3FIL6_9BURK|nr:LysR family transcriptional regulator [Noviherbaspirillum saxi]RJF92374.1 LysR family transcriptional regulator [Noviherbaspirillum saxi]
MDSRRLEHLIAVAEEGNFAKAAERCSLTQPALSRSIQTLEQELEVVLFDRHAKGATLTSVGRVVVEQARAVLREMRTLVRDVSLLKRHDHGHLVIGTGSFPATAILPDALATLLREHPNVSSRVQSGDSEQLLAALYREEMDFFISNVRGLPQDDALLIEILHQEEACYFVRPGHPLLNLARPRPADLLQYPLVTTRVPPQLDKEWYDACGLPPGQLPRLALEGDGIPLLNAVATKSDAILITYPSALKDKLVQQLLVPLTVTDAFKIIGQFALVRLAERTPSPAAERFISILKESLELSGMASAL